jgi:hypothetical protein
MANPAYGGAECRFEQRDQLSNACPTLHERSPRTMAE